VSPVIHNFDRAVDEALERLRGHAVADKVMTTASEYGDFSLLWHIVGATRAVGGGRRSEQAVILSALLGAESLVVNQGIKRIFRRTRPTPAGDGRYPQRRPSTSSFPSGHASSAFFAATVLTHWGGPRSALYWYPLAALVGSSRAYVRIHHASDVVAGAVTGLALGRAAVWVLHQAGR
jgi:undecaprenyl-diphosphatase